MADLEKGKPGKTDKADKADKANKADKAAARPAKKDNKYGWSKIPLYLALSLMVLLIFFFTSCRFLPRFVSQHCQVAPVYYSQ
ncbi:hypothetical protein Pst134EA_009351 [Puccinia striiformis f. sp. tritici]|nr:hypothetical protein Pst134EA_009351 [Puccinia striiformis f. sp. tritici]KAH9468820.1 hypothetical protein Pst134EA_009351 [Puccinia striiformis f. sp. tritici]KAI9622340.1 hypothetical protein KEM48_007229 [Puccinia striiformis f. sp. tritici PST-130]